MKQFNDTEFRELLNLYETGEPDPVLVSSTKEHMMHELQLAAAPATSPVQVWVMAFVGLAVAMSLCLFYMFTVGTILRFVLPEQLLYILRHTFYALTAAGGSVLAFALLTLVMKFVWLKHAAPEYSTVSGRYVV